MKSILANDGMDASGIERLTAAGFNVQTQAIPQSELATYINTYNIDALVVRSATKVRKELIEACPHLKIIARGGVGMDNIDVAFAESKGIQVINTPAASSRSVAELVFAHAFSAVRFLYQSNREMPVRGTTAFNELKKKFSEGTELQGKTLGILGFGRIGQAVAKMALGLGMQLRVYDPNITKLKLAWSIAASEITVEVQTESLESVLQHADIITCHVPGGELIGPDQFLLLKPGVILINTSRGSVIHEQSLLQALDSKRVAHACLDVYAQEPQPDPSVIQHPKLSLSPHIGAATREAQERIGIELAELLIKAFANG